MKFREFVDLVIYSTKYLLLDLVELLAEFKHPATWTYILIAMFIIAVYKGNLQLIKISVPLILLVYLIRQRIEGKYRHDKFEHDIKHNTDSYILKEYYEKYKKDCIVRKLDILEYDKWKVEELKKLYRKSSE